MNILLVDTAFSALPIYDYLVESGHNVWVMGNRVGDILARRADARWIEQDYSKVSDVSRHIERLSIDCIVPGCTDVSIDTCVRIGGTGLDDVAANEMLANKRLFRQLCSELDLPAPHERASDRFPLRGNFIAKPVDAFSGRGISVFDGEDSVATANAFDVARNASPKCEALAEDFVEGELHSYTTFIENCVPQDAFFVREASSINPFAVDTSYITTAIPQECRELLADSISRIAKTLSLKDGLVHTQFIWTGREPSIVEVSRRCPGDLYALLVEYSTGFRYAAKYASYFLDCGCNATASEARHVLRHTVTADERAIFGGVRLTEAQPVRSFFPLHSLGGELAGGHAGRVGVLFCEYASHETMIVAERRFLMRDAYTVN